MENYQIYELRIFFKELVNYPFLLKSLGIQSVNEANEFINSHQEEEFIYEPFLLGLINQDEFYPNNPDKWILMARYCNYNHPAILDKNLCLSEGGPIIDWYIYPRLIKWLYKNAPNNINFRLDDNDIAFLEYELPNLT